MVGAGRGGRVEHEAESEMTVWVPTQAVKTISAEGVVCALSATCFDAPVTQRPNPATGPFEGGLAGAERPRCVQNPEKVGPGTVVRPRPEGREGPL